MQRLEEHELCSRAFRSLRQEADHGLDPEGIKRHTTGGILESRPQVPPRLQGQLRRGASRADARCHAQSMRLGQDCSRIRRRFQLEIWRQKGARQDPGCLGTYALGEWARQGLRQLAGPDPESQPAAHR